MDNLSMFERLLTLPIFQGMSMNELSEALTHVRLDFVSHQPGDEVVCQDDTARSLLCIINGTLSTSLLGSDGRYRYEETMLDGPTVIEPHNMFGMHRRYSRTYTFATEGVVLAIERNVFIDHILSHRIARINMLNIVCRQQQKTQELLLRHTAGDTTSQVVSFLQRMSVCPVGPKRLSIKMTELARIIHDTRLNVSKSLNAMQDKGLVRLGRGTITIDRLEDLQQAITEP